MQNYLKQWAEIEGEKLLFSFIFARTLYLRVYVCVMKERRQHNKTRWWLTVCFMNNVSNIFFFIFFSSFQEYEIIFHLFIMFADISVRMPSCCSRLVFITGKEMEWTKLFYGKNSVCFWDRIVFVASLLITHFSPFCVVLMFVSCSWNWCLTHLSKFSVCVKGWTDPWCWRRYALLLPTGSRHDNHRIDRKIVSGKIFEIPNLWTPTRVIWFS